MNDNEVRKVIDDLEPMKQLQKKYKTIYADPPWNESGGGQCKRGADKHYPLMKTSEIINMKKFISEISEENCHLYLWVTNNFLEDGLKVMKEWGFRYVTMITWFKDKAGLGQYYRGITESCLFGIKGQLPYKITNGKRQQGKTGFYNKLGKHSQKPFEMKKMIEKVSYEPYIELFSRKKQDMFSEIVEDKWEHWGNEFEN